jgi:DNA-directed RNA polymerase III subunit RPC6
MASGSASIDLEIVSLKNRLYDACVPLANIVFNQTILFDLGIVKDGDLNTLLTVTQGLVDDKLFKVVHSEGLGWKLRTRDEARKLEPSAPGYTHT